MPSTPSTLSQLKINYPQFTFKESEHFSWSPSDNTIYYRETTDKDNYLLHELSHALLGHAQYSRDIQLLAMEREAWDNAYLLAKKHGVILSDEVVESTLDSYREWLHARSTCPACSATGLQTKTATYTCPACHHSWRVNEARICALRRYNI
ncbi:MAG TPA: hypothetical protein VFS65_00235 [Candidatus Saccharimonadales bacterium]|nr:hypothetical protein [Candidatus Saccharimonadales bacterium]